MEYLDLAGCSLPAPVPLLLGLNRLKHLNLRGVTLLQTLPPEFLKYFPNLEFLSLAGMSLPSAVGESKLGEFLAYSLNLTTLDMSECQLSSLQRGTFSNLSRLGHLNLAGNNLNEFDGMLENCCTTSLEVLNVGYNRIRALSPASRKQLDEIASRRQRQNPSRLAVDLTGNPLTVYATQQSLSTG